MITHLSALPGLLSVAHPSDASAARPRRWLARRLTIKCDCRPTILRRDPIFASVTWIRMSRCNRELLVRFVFGIRHGTNDQRSSNTLRLCHASDWVEHA
jgi:hypothetical protein